MRDGSNRVRGDKTLAAKERPIFDSIRKRVAPPGSPMGQAKPPEKARPAGRKAKHKRKIEAGDKDDLN
jgi:hypothetical protein